jgi:hypothetical protein
MYHKIAFLESIFFRRANYHQKTGFNNQELLNLHSSENLAPCNLILSTCLRNLRVC